MTTERVAQNGSKATWGLILLFAAGFSLMGAALLQSLGLASDAITPLSFVAAVICLGLGLFAFWPVIQGTGREASAILAESIPSTVKRTFAPQNPPQAREGEERRRKHKRAEKDVRLWDESDRRIEMAAFATGVPTFVVNLEQRFRDWNPAFELVFGGLPGVRRGGHITKWYEHLDNFKRVSRRADELYGEGILPLADRERITYRSRRWGRMVFTKIMSPVIDRHTGRIIGWTVALNINSVSRRKEFFEKLNGQISGETKKARYAASRDDLFTSFAPFRTLLARHAEAVREGGRRVVELGVSGGSLTRLLLEREHSVTAVDDEPYMLRKLRDVSRELPGRLRLVRQDPDFLENVPREAYDAVVMNDTLHKLEDPEACLDGAYQMLGPGGVLTLSTTLASGGVEQLYSALREDLRSRGQYENLKHQFNHVFEYEKERGQRLPYRFRERADIRALILAAGFQIEVEEGEHLDGHGIFIKARKD